MALHWNWDEKVGDLTITQRRGDGTRDFNISLYTGNAYLIMIHEFKNEEGEELYNLYNFWTDRDHMKRCLGLVKGYETYGENCYEGEWVKIRFNKKKMDKVILKGIVSALAQAFDNLTIELYTDVETGE